MSVRSSLHADLLDLDDEGSCYQFEGDYEMEDVQSILGGHGLEFDMEVQEAGAGECDMEGEKREAAGYDNDSDDSDLPVVAGAALVHADLLDLEADSFQEPCTASEQQVLMDVEEAENRDSSSAVITAAQQYSSAASAAEHLGMTGGEDQMMHCFNLKMKSTATAASEGEAPFTMLSAATLGSDSEGLVAPDDQTVQATAPNSKLIGSSYARVHAPAVPVVIAQDLSAAEHSGLVVISCSIIHKYVMYDVWWPL
jgi:hypothetical protein